MMYELTQSRYQDLETSSSRLLRMDFAPYLDLKCLFLKEDRFSRERFRSVFRRFYRLDARKMDAETQTEFFHALFHLKVFDRNGEPRFEPILTRLAARSGGKMHFSFVSKLVTTHDDSYPPYDTNVGAFFSWNLPSTKKSPRDRINEFIQFISEIKESYETWAKEERVRQILKDLRRRYPELRECHNTRVLDFLVWKAGKKE